MKKFGLYTAIVLSMALSAHASHIIVDPDEIPLASNSYDNGSSGHGGFRVENVSFPNYYDDTYGPYWEGFAVSNIEDTNTAGSINQYAVFTPGHDLSTNGNYFVGFEGWYGYRSFELPVPGRINGFYINNTTYVALEIRDGGYGKKFGGASGDDPDWFLLTVYGVDTNGNKIGTNEFYLADYRFTNNANDYIVSDWTWLSLTNLGDQVKALTFDYSSTDNDPLYGMNTPAYFAMDGLDVEFQYAPAAGQAGSTALHMDDTNFLFWADGWQNYIVGADCDIGWQVPDHATGKADGGDTNGIVCLGNGGSITMTFTNRIADGDGYDFAAFENSFNDTFLELGYVEVSSDGINFFRFNNHSLTKSPLSNYLPPTNITGYCSKFKKGYGTPFDLRELAGVSPLLDVNNVRYVRIQDIVGDGSYTDSFCNVIYDPHPTIGSAGVDLDAIGALNTSHKITASSGANGSVSPAGDIYVPVGYDQTFTITPAAHYQVDDVIVNGVPIGATNQVLFADVRSNQTLTATFTNIAPTPTIRAPDHGGSYGEQVDLTFLASASDPEDGSLTDGFSWASDIDGFLGAGAHLTHSGLSSGVHHITLFAVDGGCATGTASVTVHVWADNDGDELPDAWEIKYYGNITSITATNDNDGDGLDAKAEWLIDSAPTNFNGSFTMNEMNSTGGVSGTVIQWASLSNRVYHVHRSTNLLTGFSRIDTVPGTPPVNTYTDAAAAVDCLMYHIGVQQ